LRRRYVPKYFWGPSDGKRKNGIKRGGLNPQSVTESPEPYHGRGGGSPCTCQRCALEVQVLGVAKRRGEFYSKGKKTRSTKDSWVAPIRLEESTNKKKRPDGVPSLP